MMDEKEFKNLIKELEKDYGKGSIMSLDNSNTNKNIETISTGSLLLNDALGIGGYPKGRVVEIYGPESSGKTTMALHAVAEIQKNKGVAAFIDAEHAINIKFAENLGIDLSKLIISQPDSGEQALQIVHHLVESKLVNLIIIDSVAALVPLSELEGKMDEQTIGSQARLMSKFLRKISGAASKNGVTIIFINQIREKVGVIFGNPETTPGGRALKFFSSVRLDIRIRERIIQDKLQIGQVVKIKVVKNKMASPYQVIETTIWYKDGINQSEELISLAVKKEIIKKSGSWYSYKDKNIAQGLRDTAKKIEEDKKTFDEIKKKVFN